MTEIIGAGTHARGAAAWIRPALAGALLALLGAGLLFYRSQAWEFRQRAEEQLTAIAHLKVDQIAQWRAERLADGEVLRGDPVFAEAAARLLRNPGLESELAAKLKLRLMNLKVHYSYADVVLVDAEGRLVLATAERPDPLDAEERRMLDAAMSTRRATLTDLHTGGAVSEPHMGLIVPLPAGSAAVIMICRARDFLYPLIQTWPYPSRSSETLLVRRDGDSVLFLNELRHQQGAALKLRIPLSRTEIPAVAAVLGQTGVVEGTDYHGVAVVSVVVPVPHSPWFMVSKVDSSEAFQVWRFRSVLIVSLVLMTMAATLAAGLFAWQRVEKAHLLSLYQAEAERRRSMERYAVTLRGIGDAVISTDKEGRVELLNPVAERLTGWTSEDARGRPLAEVFRIMNEETRAVMESPAKRVIRDGLTVNLANHTLLIARDGTERPIADSGAPILEEDGTVSGVVLVFRDQSAERAAQRELDAERSNLRAIMTSSPVALLLLNEKAEIVSVNQAGERLFRRPETELLNRRLNDLLVCVHRHSGPRDGDLAGQECSLFEALLRVSRGGAGVRDCEEEVALPGAAKDGGHIWIRFGVEPTAGDGRSYAVAAIEDITVQRVAAQERERLQARLAQAQKMEAIGRLAGGVAHDFNNLLTVINGYSQLTLNTFDRSDSRRINLGHVLGAGERAAALTGQLLAFSRRQVLAPRPLRLDDVATRLRPLLVRMVGEDVDLRFGLNAPRAVVRADPHQMEQVLMNLVANAREAMPRGGRLTIETAQVDAAAGNPGRFVLLEVTDTGVGMDEATKQRAFEPFFTTKQTGEGTGLGLSIVHGIVEQTGGWICVDSQPGRGTAFSIYLPVVGEQAEAAVKPQEDAAEQGGGETILVVEDQETVRCYLEAVLRNYGYRVLTATAAAAALDLLETGRDSPAVQLVVSDIVMPGMGGPEMAARLKRTRPELKVLFVSGYADSTIPLEGFEEGASFLQKPFSPEQLAGRVRDALRRR